MLNTIATLLQSLDGVDIIDIQDTVQYPHITLTISSNSSLLLLTYCSEASNTSFNSWSRYHPCSKQAITNPSTALLYEYRSKDIEDFKHLGAFIVWNIYDLKQISKIDADKLLKKFNAITIDRRRKFFSKLQKKRE